LDTNGRDNKCICNTGGKLVGNPLIGTLKCRCDNNMKMGQDDCLVTHNSMKVYQFSVAGLETMAKRNNPVTAGN
jgi:hypothetical protein